MNHDEARKVSEWRYPPPYDFYNWDNDPDDLAELLAPPDGVTYWLVRDEDARIMGFLEFQSSRDEISLGLGMRPDLTGKGRGLYLVKRALQFVVETWGRRSVELMVAEFNQRAITVYRRAGFIVTGSRWVETNGGRYAFVTMSWHKD